MSNSVKAHLSCFLHSSCMKAGISSGYSYQEKASSSTWCMHKEDPALWKQESRSQGWAQSQFYIFFTKILTSPFSDRSINHTFSRENSPILGKKKKALNLFVYFLSSLLRAVTEMLIIYGYIYSVSALNTEITQKFGLVMFIIKILDLSHKDCFFIVIQIVLTLDFKTTCSQCTSVSLPAPPFFSVNSNYKNNLHIVLFGSWATPVHLFNLFPCVWIQSAVTRNNSNEKLHLKI